MAEKGKTKGFSIASPGQPPGPEPPYQRQDSRDRGSCCHEMELISNGLFHFFVFKACSLIEFISSLFVKASFNGYFVILFCDALCKLFVI
jgi:hypothetical protein